MEDEVFSTINQIAGYPLTILIILRTEHLITPARIVEITELSLPTARKHLGKLCKLGYVESVGEYHQPMYKMAEKASELYFMDMSSERFLQIEHTATVILTSINKKESINSSTADTSERILQIDEKSFEAARAAGIGKGMAEKIAGLKHATPEYIEALDKQRRKNGKGVGFLIKQIFDEDPMPVIHVPGGGWDAVSAV